MPNAHLSGTDLLIMKTREIAQLVNGELVGDGETEITSVAALSAALPGQITFLEKADLYTGHASCVLVGRNVSASGTSIRVDDPKLAFALVAKALHPQKSYSAERHP